MDEVEVDSVGFVGYAYGMALGRLLALGFGPASYGLACIGLDSALLTPENSPDFHEISRFLAERGVQADCRLDYSKDCTLVYDKGELRRV